MSGDWHEIELGEMFILQRGFDLPSRNRRAGSVPIVSSAGPYDFHDVFQVKHPGVVTGRYGTIGEVYYLEENFWPLNTTLYVRDFKGNYPQFVYYLLKTVDFASHSGKSGVPGINRNDIHQLRVLRPPLCEQTAIANALSDVDNLITSLEKLITKKRAIKTATMQQLLTGKTRLPGFDKHPKGMQQTELGEIPEDWSIATVRELVQVPVTDGPHMTPIFMDSGVPFLSVNNLVDNKIDLSNLRYISKKDDELFSRKCKPKKGDLLLGKAASVGKIAIVETELDFNIWSPIALIRVRANNVAKYFFYCFQTEMLTKQILFLTNSSSQGNIGMGDIEQLKLALPTKQEQVAIAMILADIDQDLTALQQRLDKTKQIKQGMMQELLTGRTRLV